METFQSHFDIYHHSLNNKKEFCPTKTRQETILSKTIKQIANNQTYKIPSTIDDPKILDEIKLVFETNKEKSILTV